MMGERDGEKKEMCMCTKEIGGRRRNKVLKI